MPKLLSMRFKISIVLILLAASSSLYAQKYQIIVGSYTSATKPEGIFSYDFNSQTGEMTYKNKAVVSNPTFLTVAPDQKHIYSVNEDKMPFISAFNYNSATGALTLINKVDPTGAGPAYVSVDANSKFAFSANYNNGTLSALPIQKDGSLGSEVQLIAHEGHGPYKAQSGPHVHSVIPAPDNKYLFAVDLGTDKIYSYSIDSKKASSPLAEAKVPFFALPAGSAPRHFVFHPNKKWAYVINELSGNMTAFKYKKGVLTFLDSISLKGKDFKGMPNAADIQVSPDGKFLYGSNRGNNSNDITICSIDQKTGKLTLVGKQSSLGKSPRNFKIDPSGNFLVVANQDSGDIFIFKRDQTTGLLTPTGFKVEIVRPTVVQFLRVD
jgi:6-phosphogluconolactonase